MRRIVPDGPSAVGWRHSRCSSNSSRVNCVWIGRPNKSRAGSSARFPRKTPCGFPTKRSTEAWSFKLAGCARKNGGVISDPDARCGGSNPQARLVSRVGKSWTGSPSATDRLRWRIERFPVTGKGICSPGRTIPTSRRGSNASRTFTMRVKVPGKDTAGVVAAWSTQVRHLPTALRRSLPWDRGMEWAQHNQFTLATKVQVYFCDPQSPWQRGTNEHTNRWLRQYLPHGSTSYALPRRS